MSRGIWTICFIAIGAAPASAQLRIDIVDFGSRGGEDIDLGGSDPVSHEECDDNAVLSLEFSNVDTGETVLDFWEGGSTDCSVADNRSGEEPDCELVHTININDRSSFDEDIDFQDLLPDDIDCDQDANLVIYVLAVASSGSTADVDANNVATLEADLEGDAPEPPSDLVASDGENSITVDWEAADGIDHQEIYVDLAPGDSCEDSALEADEPLPSPLPANVEEVDVEVSATTNSYSLSVADLELTTGDYVLVAIVSVDDGDNASAMETACAQVVETRGFCDELDHPDSDTGCPDDCSVARMDPASAIATIVLAAGTFVVLHRRRRV